MKMLLPLLIINLMRMSFTAEITKEQGVLVLTDKNFDQALNENKYVLVQFYTPWCSYCKELAPEYIQAAKTLALDEQPIFLAKVDATIHRRLASIYEVTRYPTLKFFVSGSPVAYKGGRTSNEIIEWLRKRTGDPSIELESSEEVEAFIKKNEVGIVFFGADSNLFNIFEETARNFEDLEFVFCMSDDCLSHFSAKHGQVTIFKKFDERRNDLTESFTYETLSSFIRKNSISKVTKFNEKIAQMIFVKAEKPGIFFYRNPKSAEASNIEMIAAKLSDKIEVFIQN